MPRKNTEKYQNYDKIRQYYTLMQTWSHLNEIGHALSDDWAEWDREVTGAMSADDVMGQNIKILVLPSLINST